MTGDDAAVMGGQHERLSVEVKVDSTHKCGQPVPLCGWSQAINRSSTVTQMLQNRYTDRRHSHTFPIILPVRMRFTVTL